MLNSPTRTFEEAPDDITPLPSSEEIKVKYPLLYKAEKDGKTHYLLGTCHIAALDYMPDYVFKIIDKCDILLTEAFAFFPEKAKKLITQGTFYENVNFIDFLDEDCKKEFSDDMISLFRLLGMENVDLNSFSAIFLQQFFSIMFFNGPDYQKIKMDEELVSIFKNKKKEIIELDLGDTDETMDYFFRVEEELKKTTPENIRETLSTNAKPINDYYRYPENRIIRTDINAKKTLHHFFKNDLEDFSLRDHLTTEGTLRIAYKLKELNMMRVNKFLEYHHKEYNNIFLACGYCHFIAPSDTNDPKDSIKTLLELEGFKISRVSHEQLDFEVFPSFIPQYISASFPVEESFHSLKLSPSSLRKI